MSILMQLLALTKKQRVVLDRIAINDDSCIPSVTAKALVSKGLIEKYGENRGTVTVWRYRVPLHVHIHWAELCSNENRRWSQRMKITIDLDPIAAFYLTWLAINSEEGQWQNAEDVISPLLRERFHTLSRSKAEQP